MPLNYQDPYSAFGNGLQGGMGFASGMLQLKQQKELMAQKKAQEGYDNDYKKFKTTLDFLESKGGKKLPNKTKVDLYNGAVVPFMTKYASEVPFKPLTEWGDTQDDFTTKLNAIDASSNDRTFKMKALNDLQAEAEDARQEAAVKGKIDALKTEDYKQGMMLDRQARATPELQSNPEIYNYVMNERDNLLAGNTQGQEFLRQQANEATRVDNKPEAEQWVQMIDKNGKTVWINAKNSEDRARTESEGLKPVSQAMAEIRIPPFSQATGLPPGYTFNRKEGKFYGPDGRPADTNNLLQVALGYTQGKAEAHQRGGAVASNINSANDLYQANLPEVITLRNKVAAKGLLPETRFKDLNALNQWLSMKSSDPDMAVLQGKVKLMADNLQKTIGGGQGGEWAFKVADTLLDPSLSKQAFAARMMSHGKDLSTLAKSRRSFGQNPISESSADPGGRSVVRTGTDRKTGKKVIQYSDGSVEYGN